MLKSKRNLKKNSMKDSCRYVARACTTLTIVNLNVSKCLTANNMLEKSSTAQNLVHKILKKSLRDSYIRLRIFLTFHTVFSSQKEFLIPIMPDCIHNIYMYEKFSLTFHIIYCFYLAVACNFFQQLFPVCSLDTIYSHSWYYTKKS